MISHIKSTNWLSWRKANPRWHPTLGLTWSKLLTSSWPWLPHLQARILHYAHWLWLPWNGMAWNLSDAHNLCTIPGPPRWTTPGMIFRAWLVNGPWLAHLVKVPPEWAARWTTEGHHVSPLLLQELPGQAWANRWPASPCLPARLLRMITQHEFLYQVSNTHSPPAVWLSWDTTLTHTSSRRCMQSSWQRYSVKYTYRCCRKE